MDREAACDLQAAQELVGRGGEVEVVDLCTLTPLDANAISSSVRKTGHLVVHYEATRTDGFAGEIAAAVMEHGFAVLKAPLRRVTGPDIPVPASPPLDKFHTSDAGQVVAAITRSCDGRRAPLHGRRHWRSMR